MDLQWQHLLSPLVGFVITVWILKRYAWGPLLAIMEERRNKIKQEFDNIEVEKTMVSELTAEYEAKLKDIDAERRAKLVEGVNEGKKIAENIKAEARDDATQISIKAKDELERDVAKAKVQLKNDMVTMTITAAEKIINEKLDDPKHRELIGNFIDNVEKA